MSYFSELVVIPQVNPPDTETAEDDVHADLDFLDDPARAEEAGLPRMMYPDNDPEQDPYHFKEPGKVFNTPTHPTPPPLRTVPPPDDTCENYFQARDNFFRLTTNFQTT